MNGLRVPTLPEPGEEESAALIALACIDGIGPATLLDCHRSEGAPAALEALRRDRLGGVRPLAERVVGGSVRATMVRTARALDPEDLLRRHRSHGRRVLVADRAGYPAVLLEDPAPPAVLFVDGDPALLDEPAVAVVGTRNTTRIGREIAAHLGHELARHGVGVTSGLALGIDGAAHDGVLEVLDRRDAADPDRGEVFPPPGRPIGVVASGLDISYPRRHATLQRRVAHRGVLVSEVPLGIRPNRWRFPARNRLIAALSAGLVVVESRLVGGSMSTVEEAAGRGLEVMAVPGHPLSPASAGTNQLIVDGATLVRDVDDIFFALGWEQPDPAVPSAREERPDGGDAGERGGAGPAPPPGLAGAVLQVLGGGPASLEELVGRVDAPMAEVASTLVRLEVDGHVVTTHGWFELGARGAAALGAR